jgi:hypothetical protein
MDDEIAYSSGTSSPGSSNPTVIVNDNIYPFPTAPINENEIIVDVHTSGNKLDEEEPDNRSINSYGNMGETIDVLSVKKVKHFKLKKFLAQLEYCKTTRNVTLLKYHDLALIINIVQISVIIVSTCISFFETIREDANIEEDDQRLITVALSTYIALIVAISRFLKFDEKKEQFSKLSEKWNQTINMMRMMQYNVESLDSYSLSPSAMKDSIHKILIPKYREDISIVDNETDNLLNMNEKTYYRNMLMNMRLDDQILDRHDSLFYMYKRLQNVAGFDSNIDKYKRKDCMPCLYTGCYISKYDIFFRDMERICKTEKKNANNSHITPNKMDHCDDDNNSDGGFSFDNVEDCIKEAHISKNRSHIV